MKKFGSIVLNILFAVALLGILLLGIVRNYVKPSVITDFAGELFRPVAYEKNNNGLFYLDERNFIKTVDYDVSNEFDFSDLDLNNLDLAEIVSDIGQEYGVDSDMEFIADILTDPETSDLVNSYTNEIVDYIQGRGVQQNLI